MNPLLAAVLACASLAVTADDPRGYAVYKADTAFEDVMDGLRAAIAERGLYVSNVMDIAGMLKRTGEDLGQTEQVYKQARSIEICSAVLSRAMTTERPERIVNCPFVVSVYELAAKPGTTYVAHREIPQQEQQESAAMAEVAATLKGLAEAAIAW